MPLITVKMPRPQTSWLRLCMSMVIFFETLATHIHDDSTMKSAVYLSPELVMTPGSVINKFYYNIDFPKGHIGIKSFYAEVVDEAGIPVSLQDTYLHHWVVDRYHFRVGSKNEGLSRSSELNNQSDFVWVRNSGVCKDLGHYFGFGSETRKTSPYIPDPYAIEVGNPTEIPPGYEERWMLNIHAIDTRGAVDSLGCNECKCSLYNVTIDENGKPIKPAYKGGLLCCYDETRCKVKQGTPLSSRRLYMRYKIKWFNWNKSLLPVNIYVLDVTDTWKASNRKHNCQVEYDVNSCDLSAMAADGCSDSKRLIFKMPRGGHVIYGVAHQHSGATSSTLYRKDGRVICSSIPSYGKGNDTGNEAGYIVGMSTCHPEPGSMKIYDGETLVLESNYSSSRNHVGVMCIFYILVAEQLPKQPTLILL